MNYIKVSNSIVILNESDGSNLSCVALDDELIFIDTCINTQTALKFRKDMEKKFKKKATRLILTHGHIDHFFGMGAFDDLEVIAAEAARPRLERFVNAEYTPEVITNFSKVFPTFEEAVKSAKLFMPNRWIEKKEDIDENSSLTFEVIGGHSACSSVISYNPNKALFVGDLVQHNSYPYFGEPDTDMIIWINALKKWEALPFEVFLPGHGDPFNNDYMKRARIYFEDMVATLKKLKAEKIPEDEIPYHPDLPEGYYDETAIRRPAHDFSIRNLYKNL